MSRLERAGFTSMLVGFHLHLRPLYRLGVRVANRGLS